MDWADRLKDSLREDRVVLHAQRFTALQARHQDGLECCEVLARLLDTEGNLVDQGFSFALDDFGSGMSSFSYLEQLPVQYIKIDGEFVKGILTRPAGAAIVEAVVKVARAMNILTVAESVEFPELLPHLQAFGIDYGQGFVLHRPEPL
ncbi:EAL domain-containing protein [Pollutimonas subterranea]|nr:EAL domain-containing protein [Pollutimonas subterranea]